MSDKKVIHFLEIEEFPLGKVSYCWMHLVSNGLGQPIHVPIIVARGKEEGPILGLTAAVHGNELNGISIIQRFFHELPVDSLKGTLIGVPGVNIPSLLRNERTFPDGIDLNRIMPGKEGGNLSDIYAYRVLHRIVDRFDYLLDLHTASFGRVNSYYIRADLKSQEAMELAKLQEPTIILHAPAKDGTLRGAAEDLGIVAITIEVGDPDRFQKGMVKSSLSGISNSLKYLDILPGDLSLTELDDAVICERSEWLHTDRGGVLTVYPSLADKVSEGELIASVRNIFGEKIRDYLAPYNGIVIGKSVHPIAQTGSRILHLGRIGSPQ